MNGFGLLAILAAVFALYWAVRGVLALMLARGNRQFAEQEAARKRRGNTSITDEENRNAS